MRSSNFIFVLMGLLLCSCGGDKVAEDVRYFAPDKFKVVNSTPDTTRVLKTELIQLDEVYNPRGLYIYGNMLFVPTSGDTKFLSVVDLRSLKPIIKIGHYGRGPNDFSMPKMNNYAYCNDNNELILEICDRFGFKSINVTKSIKESGTFLSDSKKYTEIYKDERISHNGDKIVFKYGADRYFIKQDMTYRDAREGTFSPPTYIFKRGTEQSYVDIFPQPIESIKKNSREAMFIYSGYTRLKPDGSKVVDVMQMFDYINIIDLSSKEVTTVGNADSKRFISSYEEGDAYAAYASNRNVCVTDKYIIVLTVGDILCDAPDGSTRVWHSIRVFDWKGNFISSAMLPKGLAPLFMAYDENNEDLYFCVHSDETFYRSNISDLLK